MQDMDPLASSDYVVCVFWWRCIDLCFCFEFCVCIFYYVVWRRGVMDFVAADILMKVYFLSICCLAVIYTSLLSLLDFLKDVLRRDSIH